MIAGFSTAQCAMCTAVLEGKQLNNDVVNTYELGKGDRANVSLLKLTTPEPAMAKKFRLGTALSATMSKAIGIIKKPVVDSTQSVGMAKAKKRGRLFDDMQVNDEQQVIGSMESINEMMKK